MLQPISQLMPSLLQVVNLTNMTENDFYQAPCKKRCGELIPSHWDEATNQWVYDRPCDACTSRAENENRYQTYLRLSGITENEQGLTLDSCIADKLNSQALEAAARLVDGYPGNLFFFGKAGRGKTHLAIGIALGSIKNKRVRFLSVTKALMEIRGHLRDVSEDDVIAKFVSSDVLILDDFGANKLTEWNLSFMDCLIDEWYRLRKHGLVITSNFGLKYISENISDRIASRLAQMCETYELGGEDHRILRPD